MDKIILIIQKSKQDIIYFLLITVLYVYMIFITYAKWAFPVIDSFRNAYVPDQILQGKVLYSDIYFLYGPLIQYFNALLFKIFAINLTTLYVSGIIVTFIILVLLYILSKNILKPIESSIFLAFIIINIIFSPGINNYIFPYSYEALYACLLSLLFLLFAVVLIKTEFKNTTIFYISSIILVILAFIKQDFALSGYIVYITLLALAFKIYKLKISLLIKNISIVILLPSIIYIIISKYIGFKPLIQGIIPSAGSFIFKYELPNQATYYTNIPGLSFFSLNSFIDSIEKFIIFGLIISSLSILLYSLIYIITCGKTFYKILTIITILILLFEVNKLNIVYLLLIKTVSDPLLFQWLGLFLSIYLVYQIVKMIKTKDQLVSRNLIIPFLTYSALIFLFRSLLSTSSTTTSNYSCIIAFMVLFYALINQFPNNIRYLNPSILYKSTIISLILITFMIFQKNQFVFATINQPVSTSRGLIYLHKEYGDVLNQAITFIERNTRINDKVMAVPEEMIINFMANRSGASRYYQLIPCFSSTIVQKQVIEDLKINNPSYIMVSNSPVSALFDKTSWGYDYETEIYKWIKLNYVPYKVFRGQNDADKNVDHYKIYTFKRKSFKP